jgi:hypothetical protein
MDSEFDVQFDGTNRENVLAVPIKEPISGTVIGVLEMCNSVRGEFDSDEIYLAELLSVLLSMNIKRWIDN